jgi:hypothetical protein
VAGATHRRATGTVMFGALGGLALGSIARAWMRLISDDPDFTWNGTLFIAFGFAVFGLTQSVAAVARRRIRRWSTLAAARSLGSVGMLPLFVGAGALMFPTVVGCGLATARTKWPRPVRALCMVVAALPVLYVGTDLVDSFGWSARSLGGFVLMLAVYAAIIWATRFTFTAAHPASAPPRRATITLSVVATSVFVILFAAGGGLK